MPPQNRVDPFGGLFADAARGLFMGNRGRRVDVLTPLLAVLAAGYGPQRHPSGD